jgi:hypothetical protein
MVLALTFLAGAWSAGQVRSTDPVEPRVLSGNDIGFRIVARQGATPVGNLVVKINDKWVDVQFGGGDPLRPITSR